MTEPSLLLTDDLELVAADGRATVRRLLTPSEALDFAEDLIRRGTRRMMLDEAAQAAPGELRQGGA